MDFLYKLASLPVYPCDKAFADALDSIFCSTPTTTLYNGPYYVKENTPAETILERNPDYSSNIQIGNKTITLYSTGNVNTLISRFNEGNYDLVLTPDTEIVADKKAVSSSPSSIWGIAFNCESEKGADVKIRKLLTSTIDYKKITLPEFALSEAKTIIPGIYGINDDRLHYDSCLVTVHRDIQEVKNISKFPMLPVKFSDNGDFSFTTSASPEGKHTFKLLIPQGGISIVDVYFKEMDN